jgi:mono/diheme cytochrome c family protein
MRELWVRIVAVITGALVLLLALAFASLQSPPTPVAAPAMLAAAPPPALVEIGHSVYEAQGCSMCHAIAGEGNPRYPLDGVGGRHDMAELRDWILATGMAEETLPARAARMKQDYRALGDVELNALVAYLQSLTDPPPGEGKR